MNNNSNGNKNGIHNDLTKTQTSTFYLDDPNLGLDVITNVGTLKSTNVRKKLSNGSSPGTINEVEMTSSPAMISPQSSNSVHDSTMQDFLEQARYGNVTRVTELIESNQNLNGSQNSNIFDINYKGRPKRFYGWTALHISCYFNHIDIVKLLLQVASSILSLQIKKLNLLVLLLFLLLKHPDCDVNACNYENDTPLHKACLTSRYVSSETFLLKILV